MKIKLIAVDLDGTLLTSRKKVSPKTLATLKKGPGKRNSCGAPVRPAPAWRLEGL